MTRPVIAVVGKKVGQEGNKSKRGANDIFVGFSLGKIPVEKWSKTCLTVDENTTIGRETFLGFLQSLRPLFLT